MKRLIALIMAACMLSLCFTGCADTDSGGTNDTGSINSTGTTSGTGSINSTGTTSGIGSNTAEGKNETSGKQSENSDIEAEVPGNSRVLIVYFSHGGNTHRLTGMIEAEVEADVIRLTPAEAYENDTLFERAQDELNNGIRPEISNLPDAETVAQYDTILVGFPIWWYDLPMPMWTFLEAYDLSGKTIIPYFTHNGSSGGAGSLDTIEKLCPNSTVRSDEALSVAGNSVESAEGKVKEWVSKIGLSE